jgi:hypothetical protein
MAEDRRKGKPPKRPGRPGRKQPPPEGTGREAEYLFRLRDRQTTVTVHLVNGKTVDGVIEYYDRDMVKVVPAEGPGFFFRKEEIRYIHETDG